MAFMTFLLVSNIIAVKLVDVGGWVLPASVVVYPLTFLVTDTLAEVYGRRTAARVVWLGFAFSLVMLALVYIGKIWTPAEFWQDQGAYETILGGVPRIVAGSMVAYLVSQQHDVFMFHVWRRVTGGRHLWLRNNASTIVSQAIDTTLFVTIAFAGIVPTGALFELIATTYVAKVIVGVLDTPIVYALVGAIRKYAPAAGCAETRQTPNLQPTGAG